jgi:hypothetical protein
MQTWINHPASDVPSRIEKGEYVGNSNEVSDRITKSKMAHWPKWEEKELIVWFDHRVSRMSNWQYGGRAED